MVARRTADSRKSIEIGIVFSTTGPYATVGREMRDGALLAVSDVNKSPGCDFSFSPLVLNPKGSPEAYRTMTENLLRRRRLKHVIGCYTSSSRKELIPVIEKFDALLWYPSHYEGFESCDSVIYGGAAPNQHLVPLAAWALAHMGRSVYCVGSNYVWSWGNNRIMREVAESCGGQILAERYLTVGSTEVDGFIREIAALRPDVVFCTLIGKSSYAFYRAYHALGDSVPEFRPERRPILSCSLSEPELLAIGPSAAGHISSSVYFQSIQRPENAAFVRAFREAYGEARVTSADAEASYVSTMLLARSVQRAGSAAVTEVKRALYDCVLEAPHGRVQVDGSNNHCYLTPRLGRARDDGQFEMVWEGDGAERPDPYLSRFSVEALAARIGGGAAKRPRLAVVGQ